MYGFDVLARLDLAENIPLALDLYWVLAIGAALVTIVPIRGIDWFRCVVYISNIVWSTMYMLP